MPDAVLEPGAAAGQLRQDLRLGLRLAVPRGAEMLRCAVTIVALAGCVAVLLFLAALPGAVAARADRDFALTPDPVAPSAGWTPLGSVADGEFFAAQWELAAGDRPLRGTDLFAPALATIPAPPGVTTFPRPGELWVSPALARWLTENTDTPTVLDGTVVGTIAPDGLLGPDELRFYRGTPTPTLPGADGPTTGIAAAGWGHWAADWESPVFDPAERPLTVLVIAGSVVTALVAGGLLILSARLDRRAATRRTVSLRLLGLSDDRCRRIGAIRGLTRAAAAVVLGAAGSEMLRAASGDLPIGASAFFPTDLTIPWPAAVLITAAVVWLLIRSAGRAPGRPDPTPEEPAPRRPYGAQVIVLLAAAITVAMALAGGRLLQDSGRLALGTTTLAIVAVLGSVAVLVPALVDVIVDRPTVAGDPRVRRALSRPFGAAAGLLTAVLVLQAVAGAGGPDGDGLIGARADLVSTARTGIWFTAGALVLLLAVGTLLAADRLGPARRTELASSVLLPTAVGVALAVPTAVALSWLLARAADLEITAAAPVNTLGWAGGTVVLVKALAAAGRRSSGRPSTPRSGPSW